MPEVESTAILYIAHDRARRVLFVTFHDGDTYRYFDVPPEVYDEFLAAESKGGFFAAKIRGHYDYQRGTIPPPERSRAEDASATQAYGRPPFHPTAAGAPDGAHPAAGSNVPIWLPAPKRASP